MGWRNEALRRRRTGKSGHPKEFRDEKWTLLPDNFPRAGCPLVLHSFQNMETQVYRIINQRNKNPSHINFRMLSLALRERQALKRS